MFRRKPAELFDERAPEDPAEPVDAPLPKSYTPKKGEATPKRVAAGRRPVGAPPADRREALRRSRDKQRQDRDDRRAGMMAGDPRYLLPRDRGPARALARDVVDSRYNVGSAFIVLLLLIVIASSGAMPAFVQFGAQYVFLFMILAFAVDAVLVSRRLRRLVRERLPQEDVRWASLYMYAVMRTLSFRRLRVPKPRVKVGEQI
jgi:Protein of unknown function (DUF3043)